MTKATPVGMASSESGQAYAHTQRLIFSEFPGDVKCVMGVSQQVFGRHVFAVDAEGFVA